MIADEKGTNILIERNGWKVAKVFSGHDPILHTEKVMQESGREKIKHTPLRRYVEIIDADSPAGLIKELEFYRDQGGDYMLALAGTQSTCNTNPNVLAVRYTIPEAQILGSTMDGAPSENLQQLKAEMKKELLAEMAAEQKAKEEAEEIQALRDELAELKTDGGKLAHVLRELAAPYIQIIMNNLTQGQAQPLQGQQQPQQNLIPHTQEGLNEALGVLVREFGARAIIDLANNPQQVETLKTFIK
jgi:hypothetical protein